MKKRTVLFGIIIIILVAALLILSKYWPPVSNSDTSGTIGKAEKYRTEQMSDKDVLLRSEFIKDTAKIAESIRQLTAFMAFAKGTSEIIDSWWLPRLKEFDKGFGFDQRINELESYTQLIKNNMSTLSNTIIFLADMYYGRVKEPSKDNDRNLIDFYNFVNQMAVRDSIFEETVKSIDRNINTGKIRKKEIQRLKDLRDMLIVNISQYSIAMGDTQKFLYSVNQTLNSLPYAVQTIQSQQPVCSQVSSFINSFLVQAALQAPLIYNSMNPIASNYIYSNDFVKGYINNGYLTSQVYSSIAFGSTMNLDAAGIAQAAPGLGFIITNAQQCQSFISSNGLQLFNPNLQGIFVSSQFVGSAIANSQTLQGSQNNQ